MPRSPLVSDPSPHARLADVGRVGPAEIVFLRLGVRRFPPASKSQVLSLLYSRTEAHRF
ncbi:MAG: hypothetical protein WA484_10855 [Solirubrobacteraceae bacterium]